MTQEERWKKNFEQVRLFMCEKHQRPSKHRAEERKMVNWYRHNRRLLQRGALSAERQGEFKALMQLAGRLQRLNQYSYKNMTNPQTQLELW